MRRSICARRVQFDMPTGDGRAERAIGHYVEVVHDDEGTYDQRLITNRAMWDEAAPLHAESEFYDLAGFVNGRDDIRPFEHDDLGAVGGLDLLHLQCHIGTDTLSWARHGANVVGLDFSKPAVALAASLAAQCGINAEFICADVYEALAATGSRQFDVVYTGLGALGWLPDVGRWGSVVASLLRPGGVVYLVEVHPIAAGMDADGRTLCRDIIDAPYERIDEAGGTYAAPTATLDNTVTFERVHSIAEVVSALLDAGLTLELFRERALTPSPHPWLTLAGDRLHGLPADSPSYPLTYSLRARRR